MCAHVATLREQNKLARRFSYLTPSTEALVLVPQVLLPDAPLGVIEMAGNDAKVSWSFGRADVGNLVTVAGISVGRH